MKIQVILGTVRVGRVSERVAKWVAAKATNRADFEVELIDLAEYTLPHFDEAVSPRFNRERNSIESVTKYLTKIAEADGYVFVTPEYNHSIAGVLKDAIDYLDFQLAKKPVAIVSHGTVGGARAAEQLKVMLIESKAAIVPEAIALIRPTSFLDASGNFTGDLAAPYNPDAQLEAVLGELAWWAETLQAGRLQAARASR
jgi:NAD(P)H-dependent FMN reductase